MSRFKKTNKNTIKDNKKQLFYACNLIDRNTKEIHTTFYLPYFGQGMNALLMEAMGICHTITGQMSVDKNLRVEICKIDIRK